MKETQNTTEMEELAAEEMEQAPVRKKRKSFIQQRKSIGGEESPAFTKCHYLQTLQEEDKEWNHIYKQFKTKSKKICEENKIGKNILKSKDVFVEEDGQPNFDDILQEVEIFKKNIVLLNQHVKDGTLKLAQQLEEAQQKEHLILDSN